MYAWETDLYRPGARLQILWVKRKWDSSDHRGSQTHLWMPEHTSDEKVKRFKKAGGGLPWEPDVAVRRHPVQIVFQTSMHALKLWGGERKIGINSFQIPGFRAHPGPLVITRSLFSPPVLCLCKIIFVRLSKVPARPWCSLESGSLPAVLCGAVPSAVGLIWETAILGVLDWFENQHYRNTVLDGSSKYT